MGGECLSSSLHAGLSHPSSPHQHTSGDRRSIGLVAADGCLYKGTTQAESCINRSPGGLEVGGGDVDGGMWLHLRSTDLIGNNPPHPHLPSFCFMKQREKEKWLQAAGQHFAIKLHFHSFGSGFHFFTFHKTHTNQRAEMRRILSF